MSAQFEFGTIFESQVEPQNRDFALTAGKRVFKAYKLCGAYDDLLDLLRKSIEQPRFEFKVDGLIEGVPFTGKPDCRFVLDRGQGRISCVYDWKVRGLLLQVRSQSVEGIRHLPGRVPVREAEP